MESSFTKRDGLCISAALVLHSLLFLFKASPMTLHPAGAAGEAITRVDFLSDVPSYSPPPAREKPQTLMEKMKALVQGEKPSAPPPAPAQPAPLVDKAFPPPASFSSQNKKEDQLKTGSALTATPVAPEEFAPAGVAPAAHLKNKDFQVGAKDLAIAMNRGGGAGPTIAIPVGRTSKLEGAYTGSSALQDKIPTSSGFNIPSAPAAAGSTLQTGSGSVGSGPSSSVPSSFSGVPGGTGTGNTYGKPGGRGSGGLAGGGRSFSGAAATLPAAPPPPKAEKAVQTTRSAKVDSIDSGFSISGALKGRPIINKVMPPYAFDGRIALRFRVDPQGRVVDSILVEISSGQPSFDRVATDALRQWRFAPLPGAGIQEGVIAFIFRGE